MAVVGLDSCFQKAGIKLREGALPERAMFLIGTP